MLRVVGIVVILTLLFWSSPSSAQAPRYQVLESSPGDDPTQKLFRACMERQRADAGNDVNAADARGITTFLETIEALLEEGADVNATFQTALAYEGTTPLILVAGQSNGKIVKALLEAGADVHRRDYHGDALQYAASYNPDPSAIRYLIEAGAHINPKPTRDSDTQSIQYPLTPLMASTKNLNPEVASTLLQCGANVDAFFLKESIPDDHKRRRGATALMFACGYKGAYAHPEVVLKLLEYGASAKPRDLESNGTTTSPLRLLVESPNEFRFGHLPVDRLHPPTRRIELLLQAAQALIDAGDDLNAADTDGVTTLMAAHPLFIPLLVEAGANVTQKSESSDTALTLLLRSSFNPEFQPQLDQMLLDAVESLLESGADVNARGAKGMTSFLHLCQHSPEMIRLLLLAGAEVNGRGATGKTPLMMVTMADFDQEDSAVLAENGEHSSPSSPQLVEAITLLLENGADVNAQDADGMTALMYAAQFGINQEGVNLLLEAGADYTTRDKQRRTVFEHVDENPWIDRAAIQAKIEALEN